MANSTLATIYGGISGHAPTFYGVTPQSSWNTFPRIVIQEISQVPGKHLNGILPIRECQATVSLYHTDYTAAKTLSDTIVSSIMTLDQVFLDSIDNTIEDRGDGNTLNIYRITHSVTFFTGAS